MIAGDQVAQGILCGRLQMYRHRNQCHVYYSHVTMTRLFTENTRVPRMYELCSFFIRDSLSWLPTCHYTLLLPQMSVT